MRKFSQAVLVFVAATSLLGFLVYKHKYEKIASVLRVLNTFGCQSECDTYSAPGSISGQNIARTMSTWQQIDEIYIYSAYWQFEREYVLLLGLATRNSKIGLTCLLWHERDDQPLIGVFSRYSSFNDTNNNGDEYSSTMFTCKTDVPVTSVPYAVSLASDDRFQATKSTAFIYVQPLRKTPYKTKPGEARFAVCVIPQSDQSQNPKLLKEFISYHAAIGITRFIIYDSGTSPSHIVQWRTVSNTNPLAFEFLPWNVPYLGKQKLEDASLMVLQQDCIHRLTRTHSHVTLQRVNQFLVPRHHVSIGKFLEEEEQRVSANVLGALVLEERHFCTDFRGDHSDDPMVVRFSLWVPPTGKDANPVYGFIRTDAFHSFWDSGEPRFRTGYSIRKVHSTIANFHYYGPCLNGVSTEYAAAIYQKSKEDLIMGHLQSQLNF